MSGDGWNSMPGQPRICAFCGERILISKQAIWFKTSEPKHTWHASCLLEPNKDQGPVAC